MFKKLICAIWRLADVIESATKQRCLEFKWLQEHNGFATRDDLQRAEERIIEAFGERVDPQKLNEIYDRVTAGKTKVEQAIQENK